MRDIDTLLRQSDPAADTPAYTAAERDDMLRAAITAREPKARRGWRLGVVAAAAVLVTALGVTNLQGTAVSARADEVLTEAAINAVDPPARADQWWQITTDAEEFAITHDDNDEANYCLVETRRVVWVAVDGNRPTVFLDELLGASPARQGDDCSGFEFRSSAWSHDRPPSDMPDSWQVPSPQFLASLPRDVDLLLERLYADTQGKGNGRHAEVFVYVADVLRSGTVPADLRASLFEVLKALPGIDVTSEEQVAGRTIVGLAINDDNDTTDQLLIDPEGGMVVGERSVYPSIETTSTRLVTRDVVDEVPAEVLGVVQVDENCEEDAAGVIVCEG